MVDHRKKKKKYSPYPKIDGESLLYGKSSSLWLIFQTPAICPMDGTRTHLGLLLLYFYVASSLLEGFLKKTLWLLDFAGGWWHVIDSLEDPSICAW